MAHISIVKWTLLPRGVALSGGVHALKAAVFVSPQVVAQTPADNDTVVDLSATIFAQWPEQLGRLAFQCHIDGAGAAQPLTLSSPANADVWRQLLGQTRVRLLPALPPQSGVTGAGVAPLAEPTPPPKVFPAFAAFEALRAAHQETAKHVFAPRASARVETATDDLSQPIVPAAAHIRDTFGRLWPRPELAAQAAGLAEEGRAIAQAVDFYQRDAPPPTRAIPLASTAAVGEDDADFHQWVGRFANYPWLLRELGLLLDFDIPWRSEWQPGPDRRLWVTATPPFDAPVLKTRCRIDLEAGVFEMVFDRPDAFPSGYLPLGRPDYSVVPVDVDGGALKAASFARESQRFSDAEAAVTPSLRSAGLSVVRANRVAEVGDARHRAGALNDQARASGEVTLSAEHLIRGYSVSVRDGRTWRSLCDREFVHPWSRTPVRDSGWTSLALTNQGGQDYLHESLFVWAGWSLVARRPGKALGQDGRPVVDLTGVNGASVSVRPPSGSLPVLRFGHQYQFRAVAVDLAGQPLRAITDGGSETVTKAEAYLRFDPVGSPLVVARHKLQDSPGQTVTQLVIRTGETSESWDTAQRHVAPPPIDPALAEWHGLFDEARGGPSESAYHRVRKASRVPPATTEIDFHDPRPEFDVDYLSDPLARGVTLFGLPNTDGGFRIEFGDQPRSFCISLEAGVAAPRWDSHSRVLTVYLRPAEIARVQLASHFAINDLPLFGVWQWLSQLPGCPPPDAAADGLLWALTPSRRLTFIHAVQRPLGAPIPAISLESRDAGVTFVDLRGSVAFDAPSTGHLEIVGEWQEMVDDLTCIGPEMRSGRASALQTAIEEGASSTLRIAAGAARQVFGDTHARKVRYSAIATSRFCDQFRFPGEKSGDDPGHFTLSTPAGGTETASDVDERVTLTVPSTARPDAPRVRYIVPLRGRHDPAVSEDRRLKSYTVERTLKGSCIRVYLDRPWFSSGDGELLAVVMWPGAQAYLDAGHNELPSELKPFVSQWGMDPIWTSRSLMTVLQLEHLPGRDVARDAAMFTLEELEAPGKPYDEVYRVQAAAHRPEYDTARRLWYCDIEFSAAETYRPFVRLALARLQPDAISERDASGALRRDFHLSRVVLADFAQLANDRSASATLFHKERRLLVSLSGLTSTASASKLGPTTVIASLERRADDEIGGWSLEAGVTATLATQTGEGALTLWQGELPIGDRRIRRGRHRVIFREYEHLPSDSVSERARLIYAEALEL